MPEMCQRVQLYHKQGSDNRKHGAADVPGRNTARWELLTMGYVELHDFPQKVQLAAHAIGLDNKRPYKRHGKLFYRPYRNYYYTYVGCPVDKPWEDMVLTGCAEARTQGKHVTYFLTRMGLDWLGKELGMTIYDEED